MIVGAANADGANSGNTGTIAKAEVILRPTVKKFQQVLVSLRFQRLSKLNSHLPQVFFKPLPTTSTTMSHGAEINQPT